MALGKIRHATRSVRPRAQRAFLNWLQRNKHRFAVPICIKNRNDKVVNIRFAGITSAIGACLSRHSLSVFVNHEAVCFDLIFDRDLCIPCYVTDGVLCRDSCLPEPPFFSREEMWNAHVFEDFLAWVNDKLARARWLRLTCTPGISEARLIFSEAERFRLGGLSLLFELKAVDGTRLNNSGDDCEFIFYPITENLPVARSKRSLAYSGYKQCRADQEIPS